MRLIHKLLVVYFFCWDMRLRYQNRASFYDLHHDTEDHPVLLDYLKISPDRAMQCEEKRKASSALKHALLQNGNERRFIRARGLPWPCWVSAASSRWGVLCYCLENRLDVHMMYCACRNSKGPSGYGPGWVFRCKSIATSQKPGGTVLLTN